MYIHFHMLLWFCIGRALLSAFTGLYQKGHKPCIAAFWAKRVIHRIEDKQGRNSCWANSNSSRSSPQGSNKGKKEAQLSYLIVFFSSSLAVPCLFCCFENGMGRNCLTLGPGCFRKAPVLLANMSSLCGSGNLTLVSVSPLCSWGISSCSWLSSRVTVLLRETSDTVPWQRSLVQPKSKWLLRQRGVLLFKIQLQNDGHLGIFSYSAETESKRKLHWMPHLWVIR